MSEATTRAEMPKGTNSVLDRRTVVNSNANLLRVVKRGDRVIDIGCGSGAITKDIAGLVGSQGSVLGIDTSEHLIAQAVKAYSNLSNLSFQVADVNTFHAQEKFDVVTSARVLQWLSNPQAVINSMVGLLKPGGCLTVLDYNHVRISFSPEIPHSMETFYQAFLKWRADAGMDNEIADKLDSMFHDAGLRDVTSADYSEVSIHGQSTFAEDLALWIKVAEARGPQLVADQYITETDRIAAIDDYRKWLNEDARFMQLYLRAVTGYR